MLFGDFKESNEDVFHLPDTDPNVFGMILEFMYSGKVANIKDLQKCFPELVYATEKYMLAGFRKYWFSNMEAFEFTPRYILDLFQASENFEGKEYLNMCIVVCDFFQEKN